MSDQKGFVVPQLPVQKPAADSVSSTTESATNTTPNKPLSNIPQPPPLNYQKPSWGGISQYPYQLEVLKNGSSVEIFHGPQKDFITIGRLPFCDILMEHPSISRYQAIVQFDQDGDAYLYDLDSAHGTRLNKKAIPAREYTVLRPGDQIRFGESTRICIFDSSKPYDPEAEMEERKRIALRQKVAKAKEEMTPAEGGADDDGGASWGFAEDAEEEDDEDDDVAEMSAEDIEAGLNKSGDASLLDVEAEKMAFEDAKRRREDLEIMYGDDSDEELYDKTNSKKKLKKTEKAETHDELVIRQKETETKMKKLEEKITDRKRREEEERQKKAEQEDEDLDAYMQNLSKKPLENEKSLILLQKELNQLRKDNDRLVRLVKLTKPSHIL